MTKQVQNWFEGDWVEVFRAGTQTDSSGYTREWTKSDLETIVKKYNEQKSHEAPVVIGHPKDNAPAFGWVEELKTDGKLLYAKFKQLVPEFVEAVKKGMYKKRSISLYGDLMLRHIGFLGAVPPAVKGLADIKFNEDNSVMDIEFEEKIKEGEEVMTAELKKQIDDLQNKLKDSEKSFNEKINTLTQELATTKEELAKKEAALNDSQTKFNEVSDELKKLKDEKKEPELTEKEKEFSEEIRSLKIKLNAQEQLNRIAEYKSFAEQLHREGKLVTDLKPMVVDLLEATYNAGKFNFSENGKAVEANVVDKLKEYLSKQPKIVSFSEDAGNDKKKINEESAELKLNRLAMEYLEKNPKLSFAEAMTEVQKQNIDLVEQVNI